MTKTLLPLSVSSKAADITLGGEALELNPFANAGITAADAPVLLALGSKGTVGADALAGRMVKHGGHGTKAAARLFLNAFAEVMGDLIDEYGAITAQTPFGTVQTFIAGTIANPQDQPDPSVNYAFLGVVIPEAYRRLFAQIETYVPSEACPAALKRIRDKATNEYGIRGTDPFYLEGKGMTIGGEGETLELLDAVTRDKVCDIAVDAESKSTVQFLCTLTPQTAVEAGACIVRLKTLAGGEGTLWPVELRTELLESIPAPEPVPIDETSDGKCRVMTFTDGESATEFTLGHVWKATGEGFYSIGTAPEGEWAKDEIGIQIGENYLSFEPTIAADHMSFTIEEPSSGELPAGTYEDVKLMFHVTRDGATEDLEIPLAKLVVEA